jgi:hypothetical protein
MQTFILGGGGLDTTTWITAATINLEAPLEHRKFVEKNGGKNEVRAHTIFFPKFL